MFQILFMQRICIHNIIYIYIYISMYTLNYNIFYLSEHVLNTFPEILFVNWLNIKVTHQFHNAF